MYIFFINSVGYILFIIELEYKFMYILFINPSGKWDIFFLLNLIIIVIKKIIKILSNPWVQPDPCKLGWTPVMGWIFFNLP